MELELLEPGLFFTEAPEAADRLAAAILRGMAAEPARVRVESEPRCDTRP
jgi:hypothetical protein